MYRSRIRLLLCSLAALSLLAAPGLAQAQVPAAPVPPLPVLPGLPQSVPASSTASGGTVAADLRLDVLTTATQDPTALDVAPDGRVVIAERQGAIKVIQLDGTVKEAGRLLTSATACIGCVDQTKEEGGIHGLALSPDFAETGRFYAYYSVPASVGISGFGVNEGIFRLSTFVLRADSTIDPTSEREIIRVPAEWFTCCHYGGDIDFLADGTLLLSVGDDTSPRVEGWNPRDNRPGFEAYNAERTAQNKADLRGKVLRMMPDGSVPGPDKGVAANPHAGDAAYNPYVYAMGFRSNYRMAVDEATGSVFVGNVGPDATTDSPTRGPRGFDELETIPAGGGTNHGWPRCVGDNIPYMDYDYVTQATTGPLSCEGMEPATLWYPNVATDRFPAMGSGGRTAMGGVVYRYDGEGELRLPDAYQGKLFFMEWSRDRIWTLPVDDDPESEGYGTVDPGQMQEIARGLFHPIDAVVGPDGAVYIAEYGRGFYVNGNSRISRIVPADTAPVEDAVAVAATGGTGVPAAVNVAVVLLLAALVAGIRRRRAVIA